jgi:hypothetical protein
LFYTQNFLLLVEDVIWEHGCLRSGLLCDSDFFLMHATAGSGFLNVVDLYDSGTGRWSTAQLSQARQRICATTVGTVAIFAGGDVGKLSRIGVVCCVWDC